MMAILVAFEQLRNCNVEMLLIAAVLFQSISVPFFPFRKAVGIVLINSFQGLC